MVYRNGGKGSDDNCSDAWTCELTCSGHSLSAPDYTGFKVKTSGNLPEIKKRSEFAPSFKNFLVFQHSLFVKNNCFHLDKIYEIG
jgi:hypothetical protein